MANNNVNDNSVQEISAERVLARVNQRLSEAMLHISLLEVRIADLEEENQEYRLQLGQKPRAFESAESPEKEVV